MKKITSFLAALSLLACGADPPTVYPLTEPEEGSGGASGSGGSGYGSSGQGGDGGQSGAPSCDGSKAEGIEIAPVDLYRYPPYAAENCALLYLAPTAEGRELHLRDLTTGKDELLAPASEAPSRPTLAGAVAAWEATEQGRQVIRVRSKGTTTTVTGDFAQATEPRAAPDAVVFTAWKGLDPSADMDIWIFNTSTGSAELLQGGAGQQRFPDISLTHVAFSDFSEDPDGSFSENQDDLADLVLYDRTSKTFDRRSLPGKQAFPLLGSGGSVVFLSWPAEHPEPKFSAYEIHASALTSGAAPRLLGKVTQLGPSEVRPSSRNGQVMWVTYEAEGSILRRIQLTEGSTPEQLTVSGSPTLFAPSAGGEYTLSAARPASEPDAPLRLLRLPL